MVIGGILIITLLFMGIWGIWAECLCNLKYYNNRKRAKKKTFLPAFVTVMSFFAFCSSVDSRLLLPTIISGSIILLLASLYWIGKRQQQKAARKQTETQSDFNKDSHENQENPEKEKSFTINVTITENDKD